MGWGVGAGRGVFDGGCAHARTIPALARIFNGASALLTLCRDAASVRGDGTGRSARAEHTRARPRSDPGRRPVRHRSGLSPTQALCPARRSRSSRRARPPAVPGTCSATPGSARTPTCTRSATRFRPWQGAKSIADGVLDPRLHPRHRARARHRGEDPTSATARCAPTGRAPTLVGPCRRSAATPARPCSFTCDFLYCCTGYYRYDEGYSPSFPGRERFVGEIGAPAALARRISTARASGWS